MTFKTSLLAATAVVALGVADAAAEIPIAVVGPITGQYATFGDQMKLGAEQAVADINAAGGINGEMLTLAVGDDACDPKQAVAVANQLVNEGVVFIAGHFCSGSSIPASAVYFEEDVLQISPASTNPQLTEQDFGNVFRVCGRDDQQGQVAAQYILDNYPDANIAIVHDKTAYGKGLADETKAALNEAGIEETLYEAYTAGEKDYSALVSKLKQNAIDVLYVGGYHTEAGLMVRQMREQAMDTQLISGDALVTNEFWSITGDAGQGTLMTFGPDARKFPEAAAVVAKFEEQGIDPEGYTLYTYAAVQVFANAVEATGGTDVVELETYIKANSFNTVIGSLDFNDKGDITTPAYVWYQWDNGTYAEVTN